MSANVGYMQLSETSLYFCYKICDTTMMLFYVIMLPISQEQSVSRTVIQLPEQFSVSTSTSSSGEIGQRDKAILYTVASGVQGQIPPLMVHLTQEPFCGLLMSNIFNHNSALIFRKKSFLCF